MFFSPLLVFKISGHSMEPTIKDGDKVLVNRLTYLLKAPKKGDIIAAKIAGGKIFIKRISKIEGNRHFLSGDNPNDSFDSRKFGMLGKDQIVGKVFTLHH